MKTQILTTLILLFSLTTYAQAKEPTAVLLPHSEDGFVRLMVTDHNNVPVTVLFKRGNRIIKKDEVSANNDEKGFIKLYDVRNLRKGDYTIEVYIQNPIISFDFTTKNDESISQQFWKTQLNNNKQLATTKKADSLVVKSGN